MRIPPMHTGTAKPICLNGPPTKGQKPEQNFPEGLPEGLKEDLDKLKGLAPVDHYAGLQALEDKYGIEIPPPPPPPPTIITGQESQPAEEPGHCIHMQPPPPAEMMAPPPLFDWETYDIEQLNNALDETMEYLKTQVWS